MNRERQKRGLPGLGAGRAADRRGRVHSEDMAQGDFFDHRGSDGSRTGERLSAQGYRWSFYAENIACGQRTAEEAAQKLDREQAPPATTFSATKPSTPE